MLAPEAAIFGDVGELGADVQGIAVLSDAAGDYRGDVEVGGNFLDVLIFGFVAEDGAARADGEIGKLRKAADEAFG